jgi:O-acetyl-ADP-ribose deacetylase (regulator of RNase III)
MKRWLVMEVLWEHSLPGGQVLRIGQGDLTEETTDAIVNAANEHLAHGGGVAGAIRRRGGEVIQKESRRWIETHGRVATGRAALTGGGNLPARYVIHAVGPVWGSGDDEAKLASAVTSALTLASEQGVSSIAIPGISSGIFGGPKDVCARVIIEATTSFLAKQPAASVRTVHFCNIDRSTVDAFLTQAKAIFAE